MNPSIIQQVAKEQKIRVSQVETVLQLLEEGNTVPFIARYRKEATGSLDEEQIRAVEKEFEYKKNLEKRKEDILRLIDEKGMLTEELKNQILASDKLVDLEDLYRPYKEKKKTKATEAIRKGLEPLANQILMFPTEGSLEAMAEAFLTEEVPSIQDALEGASHIIAELVSDNADYRKRIREKTVENGKIVTLKKKDAVDEYGTYQNYYDYDEGLKAIKLYRVLAINRAEDQKMVSVKIDAPTEDIHDYLKRQVIGNRSSIANELIENAIKDAYKRLIAPSIEREIRAELTERAEDQAIHIFSENLKGLLLQPPLKGKMVLGVDPAFRTGCKMAVIDPFGKFLDKTVIYPHEAKTGGSADPRKVVEAKQKTLDLIRKYHIDILAIGNGTASRETEAFIVELIQEFKLPCQYLIVSEAGASVYSASDLARLEFPEFHVEERSAVSIARRIQDPLSELVKIDPKSIGVGQYQHDVGQAKLSDSLDFVVSTAVNQVGVNVNTASMSLLKYVSGLSQSVAQNIVNFREQNGPFKDRAQIAKVPKFGPKTFEQSIGFLRIPDSRNALDKTPIHPESYDLAETLLDKIGLKKTDIGTPICQLKVGTADKTKLKHDLGISDVVLDDLLDAITQPTRDPRDEYPQPLLKSELLKLEDLRPGMELQGTVRNVVDFGAFIDCGIKEDGLVHISKLSKKFVKHPLEVVTVGDIVKVWVEKVDLDRKRLQLTMLPPNER
ncbi:MAG: Tex family protein [Candidatus Izemoplasmatales bacterium]|nr:Tex family protein [Candidatus Izemoplasmatales bacterium]